MKRYESYKDSGVQWIGEIPSHWGMVKLKYDFSIYAGATPKTEIADYWDGNIVWITPADYKSEDKFISQGQRSISKKGYDSCNTQLVPKGSLVFSKRAPIGTVAISETELCTNQGCLSCVPKNVNTLFFYYLTSVFTEEFDLLGSGATFKEISANDFSNVKLTLPPLEEQKAIAEWLDVKCEEIDRLIATQQRRIELLQELRQSIITRAVTRGINPDVPLRDSGIDWIGQIPSHWEISKMNYVCDVITDYVASGSFADLKVNVTYLDEPDYAMLVRTADLSQKNKDVAKVYVSKQSYDFLSNSNLFGGEIILPNIGASIGDVYMVPIDLYDKMTLAPNSIMVKTKWCDLFYFYYFKSVCGRKSLELIGQAAAQGKFNKTELRQLRLPLPPLSEQREIVAYIEKETTKVDHALQQAERQIELLQELRQSVITEVVTGKRKVC